MIKNYDWTYKDNKTWKPAKPCLHPCHEPPGYMVIPIEGYTHVCPACGKEQHIHTNLTFL